MVVRTKAMNIVDFSLTAKFVTKLNTVLLYSFVVHCWVELTACKWSYCSQKFLEALSSL
jgi:hypothetical protein